VQSILTNMSTNNLNNNNNDAMDDNKAVDYVIEYNDDDAVEEEEEESIVVTEPRPTRQYSPDLNTLKWWKPFTLPNCLTNKKLPHGIANIGNSCFFNSVMQLLASTPHLLRAAQGGSHRETCSIPSSKCAACCIEDAIMYIWTKESKRLNGHSEVKHKKRTLLKNFIFGTPTPIEELNNCLQAHDEIKVLLDGDQQCAHEFLLKLLNLAESCDLDFSNNTLGDINRVSPQDLATTLFGQLFTVTKVNIKECEGCRNREVNLLWDLCLTIMPQDIKKSLDETLGNIFSGYGQYVGEGALCDCDKCGGKHRKSIKPYLIRLPPVLLFSIQTIKLSFTQSNFYSSGHNMKLPKILDVSPYLHNNDEKDRTYMLSGFIVHKGSLSYGHYFMVGLDVHGQWYLANDANVKFIDLEEVNSLANEASIILYSKIPS